MFGGKNRRNMKHVRPVPKNCPFCANDTTPVYTDVSTLSHYLTERGKILGASKTGICSTHQRAVTRAIKRARSVALLPFVVRA